jgi:hypothetical protein
MNGRQVLTQDAENNVQLRKVKDRHLGRTAVPRKYKDGEKVKGKGKGKETREELK